MRNKKSAPFGLAGLEGAGKNEAETRHTLHVAGTQGVFLRGSCIQCGRFTEQKTFAGSCLFTGEERSFLFALLPCSCGGFVSRYAEEVLV